MKKPILFEKSIGGTMAGGNFYQGAIMGGLMATVNHAMHPGGGGDGEEKKSSMTTADKVAAGTVGAGSVGLGIEALKQEMIEFRKAMSIDLKVGSFGKFASRYSILNSTGKFLGRAGTAGTGLSFALDLSSYQNYEISGSLFTYRSIGNAATIGTAIWGGPVAGAVVGGSFWLGEQSYNGFQYWKSEMNIFMGDFHRAINNKWVPWSK